MKMLIYFMGTGTANTTDTANSCNQKYERWLKLGFVPDVCMFLDGVSMHGWKGIFTNAYQWLETTFLPNTLTVTNGKLYLQSNAFDQNYCIFHGGEDLEVRRKLSMSQDIPDLLNESEQKMELPEDLYGSSDKTKADKLPMSGMSFDNRLSNNSKVRDSINLQQEVDHLYLAGFSRGAVMTFLFAKILNKHQNKTPITIAAQEPVTGNWTQWKLGDNTMYGQAKDLAGVEEVKKCIVCLGSYHKMLTLDKLLFNQLCPMPVRTNTPPNIRPIIFNKGGHGGDPHGRRRIAGDIAFYYAGLTKKNPIKGISQQDMKKLVVTKGEMVMGRRIFNLTFDWNNYRIRERDIIAETTFKSRIDELLGAMEPPKPTSLDHYKQGAHQINALFKQGK